MHSTTATQLPSMSCSSSIHIKEKIAGYNFPFIIPRNQFCDFEEVLFNWNFNFQGLWPTKKREIMLYTLIWSHEPIVQSLSMLFNYGWCSIFKIILLSLSISLKRRKLFNMMKANLIGKFSGHAQYIPYLKMVIMIMILIIDNNTNRISGIHGLQIALSYYTKNFAL